MSPKKERKRVHKEFDDVKDADTHKRRNATRQKVWNTMSIVFGGIAIAYGISTEEYFAIVAGAVIAAIGAIRLVKRMLQRRPIITPS